MSNLHYQTCKILQSISLFFLLSNSQVYSAKQAPSSFLTVQPETVFINNKTIGDNFSYQSQSSPQSAKALITGTYHNKCQAHCAHKQLVKAPIELLNKLYKLQSNKENTRKKRKIYAAERKSSRKRNNIH